ncbi:mCG129512, isoform CRA_b, partial [Mus musculus]
RPGQCLCHQTGSSHDQGQLQNHLSYILSDLLAPRATKDMCTFIPLCRDHNGQFDHEGAVVDTRSTFNHCADEEDKAHTVMYTYCVLGTEASCISIPGYSTPGCHPLAQCS